MAVSSFSPLRYPGGKSALYPIIKEIIEHNDLTNCSYAEPYAGGAGLALKLLFNKDVSEIYINDSDPVIAAFWFSIINETENFIKLMEKAEMSIKEWKKQKDILLNHEKYSTLEKGFSAFYLNRTNRSGIIAKAGVIGGVEQNGNYKMDCRFPRIKLIQRIEKIASYKSSIHISSQDAKDFMQALDLKKDIFFYIDPPYFKKGNQLYKNFYNAEDHQYVRDVISSLSSPWFLTYDNVDEIKSLYKDFPQKELSINYS